MLSITGTHQLMRDMNETGDATQIYGVFSRIYYLCILDIIKKNPAGNLMIKQQFRILTVCSTEK
jgi:hypothetical protein